MAILFAAPRFKATDKSNAPIPGAFLQFFQYQTSALQPIYTDSTLQIPLLNPLKADANGLFPEIWLDDSLPPYKVVFSSPDTNDPTLPGAVIWSIQQYNATFSVDALTPLFNPQTDAERNAGVVPTNYAFAPNTPQRYGVKGDSSIDDTAALNRWLLVAAQGGPTFGDSALTCLVTGSISAKALAGMNIDARGMTILWPSQAVGSAEVFRINASTQVDVVLSNLKVQGGRSGSGIGTASAPFASGIAIYGTSAQNSGAVIISGCEAKNTFYAGIEVHYATNARVLECTNITHNAYAGILVSDNLHTVIDGNQIFDTGDTIITDGYGITSSTSYQSPGSGFNDSVVICNNRVTNSKRKGIDAHSGISVKIFGNKVIGFGNSGIYATCEGVDKQVRDVQIFGNTVEGNVSFVASASANAIDVGAFQSALSQQPSFSVRDNKVINLVAAAGVSINNSTTVTNGNVQSVDVHENQFENCNFSILIFTNNNTPGRIRSLNISHNSAISCTLTTQWMNLQKYDNCNVYGNTLAGGTIASTLIGLDDTTKVGIIDNNLQDAVPTNVYRKQSSTASVADGGAITHGMQITPTSVIATGSVAGQIVSVTTIASGSFVVTIKTGAGAAGTTQTIYWAAKCI